MTMHIYRQQKPLACPLPPSAAKSIDLSTAETMACEPALPRSSESSGGEATDENFLNELASEAVRQRRYPEALGLLTQLIDRCPERAVYYSNRGLVYLWLGQPQVALADCSRAIALEPELDQAYNNRAMCHTALGNLVAALADYEHAVDLNPFNNRARINLGATLRQIGDFDRALDCLEEALIFRQLTEFIYAERGRTYHLRGDWNCALADYRRVLTAIAHQAPNHQFKGLKQRVQQWVQELIPQQQWA
jgi:tetratricopeptide (TPR) repeat protein